MLSNLERYKKDLESLIGKAEKLHIAIQAECFPEQIEQAFKERYGKKTKEFLKALPLFAEAYQPWYSEAKVLIKQLLPD